ncbi:MULTISPECIES: diguanylate cyclase domain-containing protein [Vibrio]|nr:diguanylate cyclase [Vibrio cholerae]EKO3487824.1 diguanylate cyclase [Vibrio fluvialis]ELJ8601465.1 diguanylate cyclase [Vibrio cholerae]MBY7909168.1 diguanylate cyclase [Vibrio fluvialis]MBY8182341.1 diguanylate cyclase [Vibrio fluvialis]
MVLTEAAKAIENQLRKYDCIGRYGGEEFLICLNRFR